MKFTKKHNDLSEITKPVSLKSNFIHIYLILSIIAFLSILFSSPALSNEVSDYDSHMKLLAVSKLENGSMKGNLADLYLTLKSGNSNVFMDTYPISKLDTQLSTRFARDIACSLSSKDCLKYDFLYSIRAGTSYIGGPSAGASIAVLTYAELEGLDIDQSVAMTGTINSGRLIGNVGGIKQKIEAAADSGLKKVLIPFTAVSINNKNNSYHSTNSTVSEIDHIINQSDNISTNNSIDSTPNNPNNTSTESIINTSNKTPTNNPTKSSDNNSTINSTNTSISTSINTSTNSSDKIKDKGIDYIEYGNQLGIKVIPVSDLEEAVYHFTGKNISRKIKEIEIDDQYNAIMRWIADDLCERSYDIIDLINGSATNKSYYPLNDNSTYAGIRVDKAYNLSLNLLDDANTSYKEKNYYSAASRCYGANTNLYFIYLISGNFSKQYYIERLASLKTAINSSQDNISSMEYDTMPSLQTAMIMTERLIEAESYVKNINFTDNLSLIGDNLSTSSMNSISYAKDNSEDIRFMALAIERLYTTSLWRRFFRIEGESMNIDKKILLSSCMTIIRDSLARARYGSEYFPSAFIGKSKELIELQQGKLNSNPAYCISKASRIKADINAILSTLGSTDKDDVKSIIDVKLEKAKEVISEETAKGRFPIMGYSYYEYSQNLIDEEPFSSLIYSEYALELSNLDIYLDVPMAYNYTYEQHSGKFTYHLLTTKRLILITVIDLFLGFIIGVKLTERYLKKKYKLKK